jgi:hypothetical protein
MGEEEYLQHTIECRVNDYIDWIRVIQYSSQWRQREEALDLKPKYYQRLKTRYLNPN